MLAVKCGKFSHANFENIHVYRIDVSICNRNYDNTSTDHLVLCHYRTSRQACSTGRPSL